MSLPTMRELPAEILTQHLAVLGKTGSGKTSTAKIAIEQVVRSGARVCVLDPIKSDWWGLTSSRDGKREGLPFHILGGPRGHVPLHSSAGAAIGEIVATGQLPLSIVDMADFEPGGQAKFFKDFAPALLKKMRGVVYLVLEEAHLFAPKERSGIGEENLSIHWSKTMATAGRSKGIRLVLVTQRTQALHNALLGSCDTLIAHRMTAPADQEPVVKWLKANTDKDVLKRVSSELASLKTGDAWICSGEARVFTSVHFDRISTYDNSATPTGDGELVTVRTAAVDQDRLRAIIGTAVEEAKANDPTLLKKQIAELKRQVTAGAASAPATPVEVPVIPEPLIVQLRDLEASIQRFHHDLDDLLRRQWATVERELLNTFALVSAIKDRAVAVHAAQGAPSPAAASPRARATTVPTATPSRRSDGPARLPRPQQRILDALAFLEGVGLPSADRTQLALLSDASPRSSAYSNNLGALRTAGLVHYPAGATVQLTADGRRQAAPQDIPADSTELQARLFAKLPRPQVRILQALIHAYPKSLPKQVVADRSEASSSSSAFSNNLGSLRSLGLIEYPQGGFVVAKPVLFLEGR